MQASTEDATSSFKEDNKTRTKSTHNFLINVTEHSKTMKLR